MPDTPLYAVPFYEKSSDDDIVPFTLLCGFVPGEPNNVGSSMLQCRIGLRDDTTLDTDENPHTPKNKVEL